MKYLTFLWIAFSVITNVRATVNCIQEFTFLGNFSAETKNSQPYSIFFIAEDIGGECHSGKLIEIMVVDTMVVELRKEDSFRGWVGVREILSGFRTQSGIELEEVDSTWRHPETEIVVTRPEPESTIFKEFQQIIDRGSYHTPWLYQKGRQAVMLPKISGAQAKLVYYYPTAFYINYNITRVSYFPDNKYLLVFTKSPIVAHGIVTLDGFLILKLSPSF